jgi:hypothetical protein
VLEHTKKWKKVSTHLHFNVVYLFEADDNNEITYAEWENSAVARIWVDELLDKVSEDHIKPIYARIMKKVKEM